jgi:predicted nucleic acid-binding protein
VTLIVDASVAVKWVIPEPLSTEADRLLVSDDELMAPGLLRVEAANALWKKVLRKELGAREAASALRVIVDGGVSFVPSAPLVEPALQMALRLGHPVYDCVYLALAEREGGRVVTADETMVARARKSRLGGRVVFLADV